MCYTVGMADTPTGKAAAPSPYSVPTETAGDDRRAYFRDVPPEMVSAHVRSFINSNPEEGYMLANVVLQRNPMVSADLYLFHLRDSRTGKQYVIATDTNGSLFDPFNRIALKYGDEFVAFTPNGIALSKDDFVADGAVLLEDNPEDPTDIPIDPDRRLPDKEPTGKEVEVSKIAEAFKLATQGTGPTPPPETPAPAPEAPASLTSASVPKPPIPTAKLTPTPPAPGKPPAPAKKPKPPAQSAQ